MRRAGGCSPSLHESPNHAIAAGVHRSLGVGENQLALYGLVPAFQLTAEGIGNRRVAGLLVLGRRRAAAVGTLIYTQADGTEVSFSLLPWWRGFLLHQQ